jgi:hypothetical protein
MLRQSCTIFVLVLMLTIPAFSGEISTPRTVSTPPPSSTAVNGEIGTPTVEGEISTGAQASDSIVEVALSLVQSVLALF